MVRKETRAYLIRDLQMESDCKLLGIMRVKIYMLIPKLITLGNCLLLSVAVMAVR